MINSPKRFILTIDGLAGSGKTAVSREVAKKLGFRYLSSGLFYRAVGYLALLNKITFEEPEKLIPILHKSKISLEPTADLNNRLCLDGVDVTKDILQPQVSEAASTFATLKFVRDFLLEMQRTAFGGDNLVAEGRDMGTIVFPEAQLKVFLTCSPEILAERRLEQILKNRSKDQQINPDLVREELRIEIEERNQRDKNRKIAPTIPAEGALIVDNSQQTLTEVVNYVYNYATQKLSI